MASSRSTSCSKRAPEWRGRVVFLARVYSSRESLPEYLAYRIEVEHVVERVNDRWSSPGYTPVVLDLEDDFAATVAALRRYDLLLVNPVRDGLNLVAKEGPAVNERDGVLVLSREAGAYDELADVAVGVNPFDVTATAAAMGTGLAMTLRGTPGTRRASCGAGPGRALLPIGWPRCAMRLRSRVEERDAPDPEAASEVRAASREGCRGRRWTKRCLRRPEPLSERDEEADRPRRTVEHEIGRLQQRRRDARRR